MADRLDAFASLLELAEANPYTARAYRRAAETIRAAAVPVADLVRSGRVRDLRGHRPGDRGAAARAGGDGEDRRAGGARARAHAGADRPRPLPRAERASARWTSRGRSAYVPPTSFARRRPPGGSRAFPGVGPKTEARLLEALAREAEPRPRRGLLLNRARELVGGDRRARSAARSAGDARRWRDACERLAVVCAAADRGRCSIGSPGCPQIVAVLERGERRAHRRDGRGRAGRAGRRRARAVRHGAHARDRDRRVRRGARAAARGARRGGASTARSASPGVRRSCARSRSAASRRRSSSSGEIRGDLHSHTTWSDGRASVEEMGRAAQRTRLRVPRDLRPHAGGRRGAAASRRTTCAARPRRSPPPTSGWRRSASCAGSSATSSPTGGSTSPTTSSRSSTGCRRASTAASGCRGAR